MTAKSNMTQSFIDKQEWIDELADVVQPAINAAFANTGEAGRVAKDLLNGVWLGHPLHPAITDVPVGAWTMTQLLDVISMVRGEDQGLNKASDIALGAGILAAIGAAITGWADWSDVGGRHRRVGLAHALLNSGGLVLNMSSFALRLRGGNKRRGGARVLSLSGYLLTSVAAYVGGELVFNMGQAVNRNAWVEGPEKFTDVAPTDEIKEGKMRNFDVEGNPVVVVRDGDAVYAFGATCSHYGCNLSEGKLDGRVVTCQCHGSQFNVTDGSLIHGPATSPVPSYETRQRKGRLQVRARKAEAIKAEVQKAETQKAADEEEQESTTSSGSKVA